MPITNKNTSGERVRSALLAIALGLCVALMVFDIGWYQDVRRAVLDQYQHLLPRQAPRDLPVLLVNIDTRSINEVGQWPWSRATLAQLVSKIAEGSPSVIGLDILFAEKDRSDPLALVDQWTTEGLLDAQQSADLTAQFSGYRTETILAQQVARHGVALGLGGVTRGAEVRSVADYVEPVTPKVQFIFVGDASLNHNVPTETFPVAPQFELKEAAAGLGVMAAPIDADGVNRRAQLLFNFRSTGSFAPVADQDTRFTFPTLTAELLRLHYQQTSIFLFERSKSLVERLGQPNAPAHKTLGAIQIGENKFSVNADGTIHLYDAGVLPRRTVSAIDVLESTVDAAIFEGKIVLVGANAEGVLDAHQTPNAKRIHGSEAIAQSVEQILLGQYIYDSEGLRIAASIALLIAGLVAIWIAQTKAIALVLRAFAVLAVPTLWPLIGLILFASFGWMIDPITPWLVLMTLGALALFLDIQAESRQRQRKLDAFSEFVNTEVAEQLVELDISLENNGSVRDLAVLSIDLQRFTSIIAGYEPLEIKQLMTEVLAVVGRCVMSRGGTTSKFVGDKLIAFWNAPIETKSPCLDALKAVQKMRAELAELEQRYMADPQWAERFTFGIKMNASLCHGQCFVGGLGGKRQMTYSAVGRATNLAALLNHQARQLNVDLLVDNHFLNQGANEAKLSAEWTSNEAEQSNAQYFLRHFVELGVVNNWAIEQPTSMHWCAPNNQPLNQKFTQALLAWRRAQTGSLMDQDGAGALWQKALFYTPKELRAFMRYKQKLLDK